MTPPLRVRRRPVPWGVLHASQQWLCQALYKMPTLRVHTALTRRLGNLMYGCVKYWSIYAAMLVRTLPLPPALSSLSTRDMASRRSFSDLEPRPRTPRCVLGSQGCSTGGDSELQLDAPRDSASAPSIDASIVLSEKYAAAPASSSCCGQDDHVDSSIPRSTQEERQPDHATCAACTHPLQLARNAAARARTSWLRLRQVAAAHPRTAVIPLLVFAAALLVGLLGIWAGCQQVNRQLVQLTSDMAATAASDTSLMLHLWMAAATAAASVISQQPHVPSLISRSDWMALVLMSMSNMTGNDPIDPSFLMLKLYPMGSLTTTYPADPAGLNVNTFTHAAYMNKSIQFAATPAGSYNALGPVQQAAGSDEKVFWQMINMWIPSSNPDDVWGMDQALWSPLAEGVQLGNLSQPPWRGACGPACAPRRQADGSYLVFWGFIVVQVPGDSIIHRLDAMADATPYSASFNYVLYREDTPSESDMQILQRLDQLDTGQMIIAETAGASRRATDINHACQAVPNPMGLQWTLCVSPVSGYSASWRTPATVAVVFVSLILAGLMLGLMVSHASHKMLVNAMLPPKAVQHLSMHQTYAEPFQWVSVLFSDIVSYTELSTQLAPPELVQMLDRLYSGFDDLVDKHQLYKVETVGDAFMCVGGAPRPCDPYIAARRVARMALDMVELTEGFESASGRKIQIRVGMHTGNATAAVMGRKMPHWTLIGDSVNVSSRMETNSRPMQIHVSATTAQLLSRFPEFELTSRGCIDIKGKGRMRTFWLTSATAPQRRSSTLMSEARLLVGAAETAAGDEEQKGKLGSPA